MRRAVEGHALSKPKLVLHLKLQHPTITIGGCGKRCARWGTEKYSGPVSAAFVVSEPLAGGPALSGARAGHDLTEADLAAVEVVAQRLAEAPDHARRDA